MADMKRARGRPKGSGKNDGQALASVADMLIKNPKLTATAAMRLVIDGRSDWGATPETLLRRLQGKWAKDNVLLMEAARERVSRASAPAKRVLASERLHPLSAVETLLKWANSPALKAVQDYVQSPAYKTLQAWMNSPKYFAQMSIAEKYARGVVDDPFQKKIHELQKTTDSVLLKKWGRGLF